MNHSPAAASTGLPNGLILGIESSCDETSAAVVRGGRETLSNIVASQIATHSPYGGVVPELASREHLRNIVPVVRAALAEASISFQDLDAIAVTAGPGLAGALLVGISFAKSLAFALNKPLIAVNHLEGHIHAVLLEQAAASDSPSAVGHPERSVPLLALVVSGGHTHLYLAGCTNPGAPQPALSLSKGPAFGTWEAEATNPGVPSSRSEGGMNQSPETASPRKIWRYQNIGRTVDDAAGEAFDKVAKLLGLGYPGGPWIDALAPYGNPRAVPFAFANIKVKAHRPGKRAALPRFLFSFSGIKTAVLRYVETHQLKPSIEGRRAALNAIPNTRPADALALCDAETLGLIASFQHAVVGDLLRKTFRAAEATGANRILVSGGVAANRELRTRFPAEAARRGLSVAFPSLALSTDNAAMIAAAAWPKLLAQDFAPDELSANPSMTLS